MRLQTSFRHRPARSQLMVLLLAGAAIAAPVTIDLAPGKAPTLSPAFAQARGGDDGGGHDGGGGRGGSDNGGGGDRGGDDGGGRGRGGDDGSGHGGGHGRGGDDNGGRGRGGDDGPGDDNGGRGRGSDDGPGDDHGGRGRGADDRGKDDHGRRSAGRGGSVGTPPDATPARYERSDRGIEVTYSDGWREELENGRYELKDAQNRTVVERPATRQDYDRLGAIVR
ncbi:hypothetical protein RAH32_14410 [Paracoccus sp. WLY502]|uniref:hypothetical protein n=1 Tax=Paracoccus yibinensis TaxID=3068891 RepID=UPI002796A2C6|nr:hypothetical protein [Paracoccus sp. WLY502]MDQ1901633.1 hypothetical protein [Paracoccus sp. WLY502]